MRDKIRSSFTGSGGFVWLLVGVLLLVLLNNVYAWGRLLWAERQAAALARELGYTPEQFIFSKVDVLGSGIVIGPDRCDAELFFATPLTFADFEARLLAVRPGTRRIEPPPEAEWFLLRENDARPIISVTYYAAGHASEHLPIGKRWLEGNIAVIDWPAGSFLPWVSC